MTDKVQKIKEFLIGMAGATCCDTKTKKNIETIILPFVDSLQCEQVDYCKLQTSLNNALSKDIKESWNKFLQEEAAKHYLYSNILYDDVYVGNPTEKDCIEMFRAGANWKIEQMKKAAIDGVLSSTITGSEQVVSANVGYGELGKNGDKVKVIVIKED